jgi:hypothetical protein
VIDDALPIYPLSRRTRLFVLAIVVVIVAVSGALFAWPRATPVLELP